MKSTDTIKGSTLLLVQTQMILVLTFFFDSSTLPKLSPNQADGCDDLLTKEECYVSLKSFSKGKSPGTDSLTAEFIFPFESY